MTLHVHTITELTNKDYKETANTMQWNLHEWSYLNKSHLPITAIFFISKCYFTIYWTSQQEPPPYNTHFLIFKSVVLLYI